MARLPPAAHGPHDGRPAVLGDQRHELRPEQGEHLPPAAVEGTAHHHNPGARPFPRRLHRLLLKIRLLLLQLRLGRRGERDRGWTILCDGGVDRRVRRRHLSRDSGRRRRLRRWSRPLAGTAQ
eukprot:scaffold36133_cov24-Phaeocystis_antarctica.AAC.1